jgi:hypothetical protein
VEISIFIDRGVSILEAQGFYGAFQRFNKKGPRPFAKFFFPPNFSFVFWKMEFWREKNYFAIRIKNSPPNLP